MLAFRPSVTSRSMSPPLPSPPRVHAIVVHHRGFDMLDRCLRTLAESEDVDWRTVVVANGCDEALPPIVETHAAITVATPPASLGFSEANNFGVEAALAAFGPADFYYFLNNDTESTRQGLRRLIEGARRHDADVVGPTTWIQAAPDHMNSLGIQVTHDAWGWDLGIGRSRSDIGPLPAAREELAITGSALLIRSETFERVGRWSTDYEWYFEDIDLCLKVWKDGGRVVHVTDAEIFHRVSATMTVDAERKQFYFWRNRLLLAFLHWPPTEILRLLKRAWWSEIASAPAADRPLRRRALRSALRLAPRMLRRRRKGPRKRWWRFLHPTGSVPPITLPTPAVERTDTLDPALWAASAPQANASSPPDDATRRVLVLGFSPLPFENERMNYAPGARSWQFARALAEDGHRVCLACARIADGYFGEPAAVRWEERDGVQIYDMAGPIFDGRSLGDLVATFRPDIIVGAAALPSRRAVELAGDRPVWVDLFGDPMAEAQARGQAETVEEPIGAYQELMLSVLGRGDAFSVVSETQRLAAVGQLGLAGRLTGEQAGIELVHVVPLALPAGVEAGEAAPEEATATSTTAPQEGISPDAAADDAFVVLWSGGFNTWCDVDTLIDGLESAMETADDLRFIATGGPIDGHDNATWRRLAERVADSPHAERFDLRGKLARRELSDLERRADLAVVTERRLYERELGSSGRLLGWLAAGQPFVCTALSELGAELEREELASIYDAGDADDFARCLLEARADRTGHAERARRARTWAADRFSVSATTTSLRRWARSAGRTSDRSFDQVELLRAASDHRLVELRERIDELEQHLEGARAFGDRAQHTLDAIHGSRMWRLWMASIRLRSPRRWFARRR
ncbi:MAG: glycosyltransferase family 2 protein [Acidobacteriota bacterium]